jgi:hypothetical protein
VSGSCREEPYRKVEVRCEDLPHSIAPRRGAVGHGRILIVMLEGSVPPQKRGCRFVTVSVANQGSASVPGWGT